MDVQADIDQLLQSPPYGLSHEEKGPILLRALRESHRHHYAQCPAYRKFCQKRGINEATSFQSVEDFPYLPVQAFKHNGDLLRSVDQQDVKVTLQSSASSGVPSTVLLDRTTSKRQRQALASVLATVLGAKRKPFAILDLDPRKVSAAAIGARNAAIRGFLNSATSSDYLMKLDTDGGLALDWETLQETFKRYREEQTPVIILGFTYVLYIHTILPLLKRGEVFPLPHGSKVVHIGGWKKLEDQKVERAVFDRHVQKTFGIEKRDIIDFYGFTEQMGVTYPDSPDGVKHAPSFAEVIVRDPKTLKPVKDGEVGLLQFLTPLPHSYPGLSVLTDDIGMITGRQKGASGWHGTQFKVIGRQKKAEVRGCGDIMADKISRPRVAEDAKAESAQPAAVNLFLDEGSYHGSSDLGVATDLKSLPKVSDLNSLCGRLKEQRHRLDDYSVDELASLIGAAAKRWLAPESPLQPLSQSGLVFLRSFCSSASLRRLADQSLRPGRGALDDFRGDGYFGRRMVRMVPRGLVGHWLAGNVPLLGMLVLAQSILTRNANIIKVAKSNASVMPLLLESFRGLTVKTQAGKVLKGDDLLKTIAVVYFDRDDRGSAEVMSLKSDVRLAWGGREAVESVMNLPRRYGTEDIIFGPKLSYMVIGRESLHNARAVRKLARGASVDASVFDQYACASPHTIFVEEGGAFASPKQFAEQLAEQMQRTSLRIPKQPIDHGTAHQITAKRLQYEFGGELWTSDKALEWTVLYDEEERSGLAEPCYSRVITVSPIKDAMTAAQFADGGIQTVGLALAPDRKQEFANVAALRGAERFPDIGRMTLFDTPWDGLYPLERLVRTVTIGGPY